MKQIIIILGLITVILFLQGCTTETLPCTPEGVSIGKISTSECCEGLTMISTSNLWKGECRTSENIMCTYCGNGGCGLGENECNCPVDCLTEYNSESWKEIISDDCKSFSDGCNNCIKEVGSDIAACTKMACQTYEKPICLDKETGTLMGKITLSKGNCMPMVCEEPPCDSNCLGEGVQVKVYITKPTKIYNSSLLVSSVQTNELGDFELELDVGDYSIFTYDNLTGWEDWTECGDMVFCDDNGVYSCNIYNCPGDKCICMPFTIKSGETTYIESNIDHASH